MFYVGLSVPFLFPGFNFGLASFLFLTAHLAARVDRSIIRTDIPAVRGSSERQDTPVPPDDTEP